MARWSRLRSLRRVLRRVDPLCLMQLSAPDTLGFVSLSSVEPIKIEIAIAGARTKRLGQLIRDLMGG
jgi:hypothetical protein